MSDSNFVLRSFYISPRVDEELKHEAFAKGTSKNELIRKYLSAGMQATKKKKEAQSKKAAPAARKRASAVAAG